MQSAIDNSSVSPAFGAIEAQRCAAIGFSFIDDSAIAANGVDWVAGARAVVKDYAEKARAFMGIRESDQFYA